MPTPDPGQVTTCLESGLLMLNAICSTNEVCDFCLSQWFGGYRPGLVTSKIFSSWNIVWVKCLDFYNFNPVWNEQLPRSKIFWLILTGFKQWEALWDREKRDRPGVPCLVWVRRVIPSICDRKHNLPLLHFTQNKTNISSSSCLMKNVLSRKTALNELWLLV